MIRRLTPLLFFLASLSIVQQGYALDRENEITYLLTYVGESGCTFIRNGREYQAVDAANHLYKKYRYVQKKITTTEMFIDKVASKSSFSGRQYQVRCSGELHAARQWLYMALNNYRGKNE